MAESTVVRDIEEPDEILDSLEGDTVDFWETKQKELITSTVDYNLGTLADLVETGTIDLSPQYQRRERWKNSKQSLLIESFLMNVPVPPVFLNEDAYGNYSIIDGKQRLLAVTNFMSNKLTLNGLQVFKTLNGLTFAALPSDLQAVLRTRPTLRSIIILRQSDQDIKSLVFHRLNTGGVTLNAQEVRNNAFSGPLNDLIMRLSDDGRFHDLLHIRNKERSAVYREMRDAEFVLRFFTFMDKWESFSGGMERHMDEFMDDNRDMKLLNAATLESRFHEALDTVEACFDEHTFQRWVPEKQQWRRPVLAALYDAQMFGCQGFEPKKVRPHQDKILKGMQALFENEDFRGFVNLATNTPTSFRQRIKMTRDMIAEITK